MPETREGRARMVVAAVALVLAAAPPRAEGGGGIPTFGIDVEVVSLNLAVTDPHGRHVSDVREEDLAVFEDGVRQPVCHFTREKWPITLSVLIDSSDSMGRVLPIAQAAALRLLRTLQPQDRAQVAQFNRRLTVLQELTSDRAALESAVRSVEVDGETALYNALYVALKDLVAEKRGDLERRALVVLSDGNDTVSMVSDDQVLELARKAEVNVYAVGLRENRPYGPPPEPLPTYFLTTLARETGGQAFFPAALADLEGVYDRIAEEIRTLYGVAYVSGNPVKDGQWRRITIRTLRPNLLVRHRTGYYAAAAPRLAAGR